MELFQGQLDIGQWIVVPDRILIQLVVVHDNPLLITVLFAYKIDGCRIGGGSGIDSS